MATFPRNEFIEASIATRKTYDCGARCNHFVRFIFDKNFKLRCAGIRLDREYAARVLGDIGILLHIRGQSAEGREHIERGLEISRELGDRMHEAMAVGNLGNSLSVTGQLQEAKDQIQHYLTLSRELGNRRSEMIATGNLGGLFLTLGRLREGREHSERSLALAREIGSRSSEAMALANLGLALRMAVG